MKRKILKLTALIIISILINSCSSMYIPSITNIPLLESKGEKQIELTASTTSLHLSGDYAFSKKYAIMVNGSLSYGNMTNYYDIFCEKKDRNGYWDEIGNGEFSHRYGELGIGRYNKLPNKLKLEVYIGFGYGQADDKRSFRDTGVVKYVLKYNASYYLGFVQLNFGKSYRRFDWGWALRLGYSCFDYAYNDVNRDYRGHYDLVFQKIKFNLYHYENMVFLRVGGDKLKGVVRIGLSNALQKQSFKDIDLYKGILRGNVNTTNILLSVGLNYKFGMKKWKE